MASNRSNSSARENEVRIGWRMAGIGFEVASEVAAGALIGWLIDYLAGTDRTWTLIGAIAGIVIGLFSLIRQTLKLNKQLDQSRSLPKTPKEENHHAGPQRTAEQEK